MVSTFTERDIRRGRSQSKYHQVFAFWTWLYWWGKGHNWQRSGQISELSTVHRGLFDLNVCAIVSLASKSMFGGRKYMATKSALFTCITSKTVSSAINNLFEVRSWGHGMTIYNTSLMGNSPSTRQCMDTSDHISDIILLTLRVHSH